MVGTMRVGLLTRWVGVLGIFTGVLIFLPIGGATLEVVPAFWMVAMGLLYAERWPGGDPPAWTSGKRVRGPPERINALPGRRPQGGDGPPAANGADAALRRRRRPGARTAPRASAASAAPAVGEGHRPE